MRSKSPWNECLIESFPLSLSHSEQNLGKRLLLPKSTVEIVHVHFMSLLTWWTVPASRSWRPLEKNRTNCSVRSLRWPKTCEESSRWRLLQRDDQIIVTFRFGFNQFVGQRVGKIIPWYTMQIRSQCSVSHLIPPNGWIFPVGHLMGKVKWLKLLYNLYYWDCRFTKIMTFFPKVHLFVLKMCRFEAWYPNKWEVGTGSQGCFLLSATVGGGCLAGASEQNRGA